MLTAFLSKNSPLLSPDRFLYSLLKPSFLGKFVTLKPTSSYFFTNSYLYAITYSEHL